MIPIAATSCGADLGVGERLLHHVRGHRPDLLRVVLHPSRTREVLGEFAVAATANLRLLVEDENGRAGGALVDGDDGLHCLTQVKLTEAFAPDPLRSRVSLPFQVAAYLSSAPPAKATWSPLEPHEPPVAPPVTV